MDVVDERKVNVAANPTFRVANLPVVVPSLFGDVPMCVRPFPTCPVPRRLLVSRLYALRISMRRSREHRKRDLAVTT